MYITFWDSKDSILLRTVYLAVILNLCSVILSIYPELRLMAWRFSQNTYKRNVPATAHVAYASRQRPCMIGTKADMDFKS